MNAEQLTTELKKFLVQQNAMIFLGAGVGKRIGMPTWMEWIESLGEACSKFGDSLSQALVKERASEGDLLGAATVYKTSRKIPVGEMWKHLAAPFATVPENLDPLQPLFCLPAKGIVTTNYDRSLHAAYARFCGNAAIPLELDDSTLKNAMHIREFFIARIHGRSQKPQSMVTDTTDYEKLKANIDYRDFLTSLLRDRPTLFLGFSFLDPAINEILAFYKESFGPVFPNSHLCVVPEDVDPGLENLLRQVSIRTLKYSSDDGHSALWRALRGACEKTDYRHEMDRATPPADKESISALHRLVSFTYARTAASHEAKKPAFDMAIDGLVLSLFEPDSNVGVDHIVERIRTFLKIDQSSAFAAFNASSKRLLAERLLEFQNGSYYFRNWHHNELEVQLEHLSKSVLDRLKVLKGRDVPSIKSLNTIWERIFMARTWDLAAHYAGSIMGKGFQIEGCVREIVTSYLGTSGSISTDVAESILHILNYPMANQQKALTDVARSAITVQVVMSSPRNAIYKNYGLPTKIYLDASVLMPAIVTGHPMAKAYRSTIDRLSKAVFEAGYNCELVLGESFLEEIIIHRQNAIRMVEELHLERYEAMQEHILFYGAQNTNVFVGAFSSIFKDETKKYPFQDFLVKVAPYRNEAELKTYLNARKILTKEMTFRAQNNAEFITFFNLLSSGYENSVSPYAPIKHSRLIEHEAQQLTQLHLDLLESKRSIFVTADKKFIRVIQNNNTLNRFSGSILSEIGFFGLVDILIGIEPDPQAFSRLVWASPRSDAQKQIQDYLIEKTLRRYDEALLSAMPDVLNGIMAAENIEMKSLLGDFQNATDVDSAKRVTNYLDRLENQYFTAMRFELEKREKERL